MAIPKDARVVRAEQIGADTRLLELAPSEPLAFTGGQYIIVDSGRRLENGKAVKRAYSIVTADTKPDRFEIAVKRIPGGPGSSFIHDLDVGAQVRFSGPWGKLFPASVSIGRTLVLATDTGISAALGLVQSVRFAPLLSRTTLVWLRASANYFLPEALVRSRIPVSCAETRIETLADIGDPERIEHARGVLAEDACRGTLEHAFISGDGAVNYALLDDLVAAGVSATKDNVESFFNMPKKSA